MTKTTITLEKRSRLDFIDILKSIAILCIVLLHFEEGIIPKWINTLIGSFMITAFYVVVGTMHAYKDKHVKPNRLIIKRFRQLMIPYFWFSLFIICFDCFLYFFDFKTSFDLLKDICYTLMFRGIGTLWFLPVLLVSELLFSFVQKSYIYRFITLLFTFGFFLLKNNIDFTEFSFLPTYNSSYNEYIIEVISSVFLTIERTIIATVVISASYWLEKKFSNHIRSNRMSSLIYGFLLIVFSSVYSLFVSFSGDFDWIRRVLVFIFLPYGVLLVIYSIINYVNNNLLLFFGKNSLIVMLTHYSFLLPIFTIVNGGELHGIYSIVYFGITVILEIPIIIIINKHFKYLIGK